MARMITEVEAYDGERDQACHARRGRTARNAVMYEPGGVWYVYLCYGVHEMLNLVTGPQGYPAAVLIRGVEGARGPGRLTRALGIDRRLNGAVCALECGLWIEDRSVRLPRGAIEATPRIGVDYAGPVWAKKPWRFAVSVVVAGRAEAGLRQGYGTAEAGAGVSPFDGFDKLTAGMLRAGAPGYKFPAGKDAP